MKYNQSNPAKNIASVTLEDIERREHRRRNIFIKMQMNKFKEIIKNASCLVINKDEIILIGI